MIHIATGRADTAPFWETYGRPPDALWRNQVYRAQHVAAIRLERHRRGRHDKIQDTCVEMRAVVDHLLGHA